MSIRTPITRAYCVQLDEVLSISEARRAFFSSPEPRRRFEFLCSSEECRQPGNEAKITAVNYDRRPNDTYKAAHFRENPAYRHSPECDWVVDEEDEGSNGRLPGESEADAKQRHAKRKLHDYIDTFDPGTEQLPQGEPAEGSSSNSEVTGKNLRQNTSRAAKRSNNHRTSSLERLVECYRHARQELTDDEFKAMKLRVLGEGEIPLSQFFRKVSFAKLGAHNRVLHGGARLDRWFGAGFRLKFIDWLDKKPVFLYVSKEQMNEYRFRRYLDETLRQEDADYFRVFAIGELALSSSGKSIDLKVADLRQLVLIPGQKATKPLTPPAPEQEVKSSLTSGDAGLSKQEN